MTILCGIEIKIKDIFQCDWEGVKNTMQMWEVLRTFRCHCSHVDLDGFTQYN